MNEATVAETGSKVQKHWTQNTKEQNTPHYILNKHKHTIILTQNTKQERCYKDGHKLDIT